MGKEEGKESSDSLKAKTGIPVIETGLYISETEPYLAAPPDGICDDRVIEVKVSLQEGGS